MSKFTTFYEWLDKQKSQKSTLGSLASDVVRDASFPKDVASLDALLAYLKSKKTSGLQLATAKLAWQTYSRGSGPTRPL